MFGRARRASRSVRGPGSYSCVSSLCSRRASFAPETPSVLIFLLFCQPMPMPSFKFSLMTMFDSLFDSLRVTDSPV